MPEQYEIDYLLDNLTREAWQQWTSEAHQGLTRMFTLTTEMLARQEISVENASALFTEIM